MTFEHNSIPVNLRPINVMRNLNEEPRITAQIPDRFIPSSTQQSYPASMAGYRNLPPGVIPQWAPQIPMPVDQTGVPVPAVGYGYTSNLASMVMPVNAGYGQTSVNQAALSGNNGNSQVNSDLMSGIGYNPNMGNRNGSSSANGSDYISEEGSEDSVSGKKVKFLCSFGGKILPRPYDGALRYVGGQTRIISVRRDVSFNEFVQKMVNVYGQPVVTKYQLPDEDLDALVSVSCPDDLDNMMDEYTKLVENSSHGSAKLRVFLFSTSELDNSGMVQFGDLQDNSGQRYVEAVNGIMEGGVGIGRKESVASATSTQNSDISGTEALEIPGSGQGDVRGNSVIFNNSVSNPNPDVPRIPLGIPVVNAGPPRNFSSQLEIGTVGRPQVGFGLQQAGGGIPLNLPPTQTYVEPQQEISRAEYMQTTPQMSFPNSQLLSPAGPVYTEQFVPVVHMTMSNHPSQIGLRPTMAQPLMQPQQPLMQPQQPLMQPQQTRLDRYPEETTFTTRVVQLPHDQGYYQAQIAPGVVKGGNAWPQVPPPEHVVFSDGSGSYKQDQRDSVTSPLSSSSSVYSPRPEDAMRLHQTTRVVATGPLREGNHIDQQIGMTQFEAVRPKQNIESQQPSYGMFGGDVPQSGQEAGIWQPLGPNQYQNMPVNNNEVPYTGGLQNQASERLVGESPKVQYGNFVGSSPRNDPASSSHDQLKPVDMLSPKILATGEQNKSPVEIVRSEDVLNQSEMAQQSLLDDIGLHQQMNIGIQGNQLAYVNDRIPNEADLLSAYSNSPSSLSTSVRSGDTHDTTNSLFSVEDPWNLRHDIHVPPKPSNIPIKKESGGTKDPFTEDLLGIYEEQTSARAEDGAQQSFINSSKDLNHEHAQSSKGSSEDLVKQELKAVAEGVAASVFESGMSSNHEVPADENIGSANEAKQETDLSNESIEMQRKAKFEDVTTKLPDRVLLGFPASDGIGRLQIIPNGDLEELRELGSGTFGTVYHGKWRGTDVAIKRINDRCFGGKPSEQEQMVDDFWNEAIKLADLHHPNVVAFYGVVLDGPGGTVATVTEYMVNGSLRTALQKNERSLDKRKRLLIAMDVAFGMEYLHGKNIVHFDLKSDNLLVNLRDSQRPICKVGDLGLSKVKCQTLISGGVRGTLPWMAPELLNGSSSLVSDKVDVFSFGIVLWELLTGEEPYADLHYGAIIGGIVSNTLRPEIPSSCDPEWKSLMERCWSAEPSERPNFTEIANKLRTMSGKIPPKGQSPSQPAVST
ncbi:hypothetical protein ACFE04_001130 [Oxalis oulophora]